MVFKGLIAAALAVALAVTPTVASATQAAAASRSATEIAPATESVEGSELRGGFIIPLAVIIAVILGILALTSGDEDQVSA